MSKHVSESLKKCIHQCKAILCHVKKMKNVTMLLSEEKSKPEECIVHEVSNMIIITMT